MKTFLALLIIVLNVFGTVLSVSLNFEFSQAETNVAPTLHGLMAWWKLKEGSEQRPHQKPQSMQRRTWATEALASDVEPFWD